MALRLSIKAYMQNSLRLFSLIFFFSLTFSGSLFSQEEAATPQVEQEKTFIDRMDAGFGHINGFLVKFLFFDASFGMFESQKYDAKTKQLVTDDSGAPVWVTQSIPFVVLVLIIGSLFFTFYHRFINIKGFRHAIHVVQGKYDSPHSQGEITHFQALCSALSATVGLGNIAGVAVAVTTGGPGAVFWMMLLAVFGMSAKFHECTLAQMYREVDENGQVMGGPMVYLKKGLASVDLAPLGSVLAVLFAILCIGGSFGGGNMFQANQSYEAFASLPFVTDSDMAKYIFGIVLAFLVGIVIIGGIKRIASWAEKIVPTMVFLYVGASLIIIIANFDKIPGAISLVFSSAFDAAAMFGGFVGIMITGFKRAAFSNEAGIGSAAICHSAAKTDEPVREGIVASLGPFIDTIVICFMTASVLIITGAYENAPEGAQGAAVTAHAFKSLPLIGNIFDKILIVCIILFAFSTMISWSYYGEKCWSFLFGKKSLMVYRILFVIFVFIGTISKLGNVLDFSDLMILCMAFPNIVGGIILAPKVKPLLKDYWTRYKSGQMKTYKSR